MFCKYPFRLCSLVKDLKIITFSFRFQLEEKYQKIHDDSEIIAPTDEKMFRSLSKWIFVLAEKEVLARFVMKNFPVIEIVSLVINL